MGHNPIPPQRIPPRLTRLEALKAAYVAGKIEVGEFELRVAALFASGTADDPAPLRPDVEEATRGD